MAKKTLTEKLTQVGNNIASGKTTLSDKLHEYNIETTVTESFNSYANKIADTIPKLNFRDGMTFYGYTGDTLNTYLWDFSECTNGKEIFNYCTKITDIELNNFRNVTNMQYMCRDCANLKYISIDSTESAIDMNGTFYNCSALTTIDGILNVDNLTGDTNNPLSYTFAGCNALEDVRVYGLKKSINWYGLTKLSKDSILYLFNNAQQAEQGAYIQFSWIVYNKLTPEEIAIATNKGFTILKY